MIPSVSTSSSSTKALKKNSSKRKLVVVADPSVKEVDVAGEVVAIIVKKAKYEKTKDRIRDLLEDESFICEVEDDGGDDDDSPNIIDLD